LISATLRRSSADSAAGAVQCELHLHRGDALGVDLFERSREPILQAGNLHLQAVRF